MTEILTAALAGILAGVGTGFAGLSAAVFIAPMLIAFAHLDSYSAVGIALASDVLASALSAATYYKNGNTAIRRGSVLMGAVLSFAVVGSVASWFFTGFDTGERIMSLWLIVSSLLLGLKFLFFPGKNEAQKKPLLPFSDTAIAVLCGIYIGFVCGFQGTGGGMMMLFVLNILLRFEFKKAVGTSVWIMSFTALIGAVSHFAMRGIPDVRLLAVCVIFTLIGAEAAAIVANRMDPVFLKRVTGGLMTASGAVMLASRFL